MATVSLLLQLVRQETSLATTSKHPLLPLLLTAAAAMQQHQKQKQQQLKTPARGASLSRLVACWRCLRPAGGWLG